MSNGRIMMHHILNGDHLAEQLRETGIDGEFIVCRECLIEGPVQFDDLEDFWSGRAEFISATHQGDREHYFDIVVSQMEKIMEFPEGAEVCLWFEHDLFCQANMWFVMSLVEQQEIELYRIFPVINNEEDTWKGFGIADSQMLEQAFQDKIKMTPGDIALGKSLWHAYSTNDLAQFAVLSKTPSQAFKYLPDVCLAHLDRFPKDGSLGRPHRVIKELREKSNGDFNALMSDFFEREGIYGFGDVQVRRMVDELNLGQ